MGIVYRESKEATPIGLSFGAIADSTAGGRQVDGFHGLSLEYMKSPKFLQVDGGWKRIVWLPTQLKEMLKDYIPTELFNKIPTDNEVKTVEELKTFLKAQNHPIVERWKEDGEIPTEPQETEVPVTQPTQPEIQTMPYQTVTQLQPLIKAPSQNAETFTFSFKNVKISAEKLIIRKKKE